MNGVATGPMLVNLQLSNIQVATSPINPCPSPTNHHHLYCYLYKYNLQHKPSIKISRKQIDALFYCQVFTLVWFFTAFNKAQAKSQYCWWCWRYYYCLGICFILYDGITIYLCFSQDIYQILSIRIFDYLYACFYTFKLV